MFSAINERRKVGTMLPVRAPEDIEYLVKESEVITGHPDASSSFRAPIVSFT